MEVRPRAQEPKLSTKAGRFADAAEDLGWEVNRIRDTDEHGNATGTRIVKAKRGREQYNFAWTPNDADVLVFDGGYHWIDDQAEEFSNVAAALRAMAEPAQHITPEGKRLPFDPFNDTDSDILDRLRGRTITWRNSISGAEEEGDVPAHGNHTKIRMVHRRVIDFAATEGGFRTVMLDAIVKVK